MGRDSCIDPNIACAYRSASAHGTTRADLGNASKEALEGQDFGCSKAPTASTRSLEERTAADAAKVTNKPHDMQIPTPQTLAALSFATKHPVVVPPAAAMPTAKNASLPTQTSSRHVPAAPFLNLLDPMDYLTPNLSSEGQHPRHRHPHPRRANSMQDKKTPPNPSASCSPELISREVKTRPPPPRRRQRSSGAIHPSVDRSTRATGK